MLAADAPTLPPIGPAVPSGAARRPDRSLRLEGDLVSIVALDPDRHAPALYRAVAREDVEALYAYLPAPPPRDEAAFRATLAGGVSDERTILCAILDRASGEPLGHAAFMRIEPEHRAIEVGNILFTAALRRTRAATEAMALMAGHVFEEGGFRRYEWKCNALNAPSRRAALRLGFTYEGTFRQHMVVKGRSRDTAWFAMLADEWPARRGSFARALAPENFGPDGRQRLALSALNDPALAADGLALRRAARPDLPAFAALQEAAYGPNRAILDAEPLPLLSRSEDLLGSHEIWLAQDGKGLAGALVLDPRPHALLVWSVAVAPDRQNEGVGRRLRAAADARAVRLGLDRLELFTGEALTKNVAWYKRRGYAVDRVETRPDRRIVHMAKALR